MGRVILEWTEDRVEQLRRLWDSGASARTIAGELGTSRCSILGKAHRLNLKARAGIRMFYEDRRASEARSNERRVKATRERRRKGREMQKEQLTEVTVFEGALNIPFAELRDFSNQAPNQCRYIAAEPPGPDYLACGNETTAGQSFCAHCYRITRANYTNTPAERAEAIRIGTRNYLRAQRRAA